MAPGGPIAARLGGARPGDGRLHLQHGPIDLIIEAFGRREAVEAAYLRATAAFDTVLTDLVVELTTLRQPLVGETPPGVRGAVARRMVAACWPYRDSFITPMAAVAGSVADYMMVQLMKGDGSEISRAYVNNGGDIALYLAPGEQFAAGVVADVERPAIFGTVDIDAGMPVRGLATSGRGGRSFSLGIADAVTVLAATAAEADAAATRIANAIDVDHPAVRRAPACAMKDDSDLGDMLVTVGLDDLPRPLIEQALNHGMQEAQRLRDAGLIQGAVLMLRDGWRVVGTEVERIAA